MGAKTAAGIDKCSGDEKDRARAHQARRHDKYERHNQRRRMAEPVLGVFGLDHAEDHAEHQGGKGHKIIAEAPPEHHSKNGGEEGKENDLFLCHALLSLMARP